METWILKMVRIRASRRIAACAVVLASVAVFGFFQHRYIRNFLMGPYELGASELDAIEDITAAPQIFAKVTGSRVIDTEIQEYTVHEQNGHEASRSVAAGYYALDLGDRYLICRSGSGSGTTYVGELAPLTSEFAAHFFDTPDMQSIRHLFYPYYLNDESFRLPGYIAVAVLLIAGLFLVRIARSAWKHLKDPSSHPVYQRVQGWGDPVGLAVAVEGEARSPLFKGRKGWSVTDRFLVRSSFFTFDLLRVSDLLWAYKKVTKHSVNFIPTGKTYESVLYCYGGNATIQSKEKTTDAILEFLSRRAPWAVFGYSKELEGTFRKNREAFYDAVEQRRREVAQHGQQDQADD
jgi:hypothetical protein